MKTIFLGVLSLITVTGYADSGIPESCVARIEKINVAHFEGVVTKANLTYVPAICAGIRDRYGNNSCSIFNSPATCRRGPNTHKFRNDEGHDVTLTGNEALCDYMAKKHQLTGEMKYSCTFNEVVQVPQVWTPACVGAEMLTSGNLVREATSEEVKELKCEALSECLQGSDLSYFERRSARKWYKNLNCN